jgi:hypothetical protein
MDACQSKATLEKSVNLQLMHEVVYEECIFARKSIR